VPDDADDTPTDEPLRLRRELADQAVVFHAVGELDHVTASRLADELTDAGQETAPALVVLDMTGISFIASAGLAVLIEHHQRGQRTGRELRIVVGDSVVGRAIERTGLAQLLPVYATTADALPDA
jgi:anti-sigma B factor antagonist